MTQSRDAAGAPGPDTPGARDLELEQRRALATREDTARGLFFQGVLEAVRGLVGPEAESRCRRTLPERRYLDFFSYPIDSFLQLSFLAVSLVGPHCGGLDEAWRRMGARATRDFLESSAGRTLLMLARSDPRHLLVHLPVAFRAAVSYGDRAFTWTAPRQGIFSMRRDFMPPAYHEGVLQEVLEAVSARNVRVSGQRTGPLDADYALSWE